MFDLLFNNIAYADGVDNLLFKINKVILNPLIELAFIVALCVFLFGVMEFIFNAESEQKRTTGKKHMLWGVVGLLIMLTVFGVISLLTTTLGIDGVRVNNKEQTFTPPPFQELVIPN